VYVEEVEVEWRIAMFQNVKNRLDNPAVLHQWGVEYNRLLALGAEMVNEPKTHPWGARSFQIKDPDGSILNFRSMPKGE